MLYRCDAYFTLPGHHDHSTAASSTNQGAHCFPRIVLRGAQHASGACARYAQHEACTHPEMKGGFLPCNLQGETRPHFVVFASSHGHVDEYSFPCFRCRIAAGPQHQHGSTSELHTYNLVCRTINSAGLQTRLRSLVYARTHGCCT